ncbi:SRPBCC domain-containing protein [Microbacterium sp. P5_E9]
MTDRTDITGTVTDIDGHPNLVLTRTFAARPVVVWRALTESEQLEKWIGGWEGDPTTGQIMFFMTAEADDPVPVEYTILECDPPRRFVGDTAPEAGAWHLWFELVPRGDSTLLIFGQRLNPGEDVGSIGPGWEYYLDRLMAVHQGRDPRAVAWDDYYPAMEPAYERLVAGG